MTDEPPLEVFAALADPTRRQIVDWLADGGTGTATELAGRLPMSRQAVSRHLTELAAAGLVVGTKSGREVRFRLVPTPLATASSWLDERTARWEETLRRLVEHVADEGG